MTLKTSFSAAGLLLASSLPLAHASTYPISFAGSGVSGSLFLTYGTATDAKYPQAYEITGVSGTFTDESLGLLNAAVTGLVPINHAAPEPTNLLAPADFSHYDVATGLPPENNGHISFSNLLYPGGSPRSATDYPFSGGVFDIYGLLFTVTGGDAVDFWSNGVLPGSTAPDYGIAVVNSQASLDYVGGVTTTPEPGSIVLLATGLLGAVATQKRRWQRV